MEYNEIRELLTRYWEGETSLEEEDLLRSFFAETREELPADLLEGAALFGYFVQEGEREMPALEMPVFELGDLKKDAQEEVSSQEGKEITKRNTVVVSMPRPYQHWMKYAAVLLLGAGLVYSGRQFKMKQAQMEDHGMAEALNKVDTYEDPKDAYVATKKALELLAKNLNKGTAQAKKIAYFNEATEIIKAD